MEQYQSGALNDQDDSVKQAMFKKLIKKGAVVELLEPAARSYVNIP
jgi:hypothetical protein